jgi:hypothetical protein
MVVVHERLTVSEGNARNFLPGDSLCNVHNGGFSFASDDNVNRRAQLKDFLHIIGGLLATYHGQYVGRERVHQVAHLIEVILPIDADAQHVNMLTDELPQPFRFAKLPRKSHVNERELAYVRPQRCSDVLEAGGWKDGQTERPGMAVPFVWMEAKRVLIHGLT